jgi:hypothetical protein
MNNYFEYLILSTILLGYLGNLFYKKYYNNNVLIDLYDNTYNYNYPKDISINNNISKTKMNNTLFAFNEIPT